MGLITDIAGAVGEVAKTGYEIYQNDREYNAQQDITDWNKKYQLAMAWQQQQNRADDIRRSDRILAENRAREDSAWQRAVADIQKAGLSTTMLSGGASSGATATNVGSGASNGGGVHSGVRAGRISGVDFGALVEMKKQEQEIENAKETNELIKAQKNYYNSLKIKTDADAKNVDVRTEGQLITNDKDALDLTDKQTPSDKKSLIKASVQSVVQGVDWSNTRKAVNELGLDWNRYKFNPAYYFRHYKQVESYARRHYN